MKKTLLIPIDFSVESLNTLKYALEQNKHEKLDVVLMYSENLPSSISDMLFYSHGKSIQSLLSSKFTDAINIIGNTYESAIKSIKFDVFNGINKRAFLNFYEANKIDLVYIPLNYRLVLKKNGFDPIPLIKKSKVACIEVSWNSGERGINEDELNQLFK